MNPNILADFSLNSFVPFVVLLFGIIELFLVKIFPINIVFALIIFIIGAFLLKKSFFEPSEKMVPEENFAPSMSKAEFFGLEKKEIEKPSGITLDDFIIKAPRKFTSHSMESAESMEEIKKEFSLDSFIAEKPKHVEPVHKIRISKTVKEQMFNQLKVLTREMKEKGEL